MKDASHHRNQVQRKVIRSSRKTVVLAVMEKPKDEVRVTTEIKPNRRVFKHRSSTYNRTPVRFH